LNKTQYLRPSLLLLHALAKARSLRNLERRRRGRKRNPRMKVRR